MTATAEVIRLADYRPPAYTVTDIALRFELDFETALVHAELELRRHPARPDREPLRLNGENLELLTIALDGEVLPTSRYRLDAEGLTVIDAPDKLRLSTCVRIRPSANTRLEGLYQSGAFLLTQCEAQGFRHITYCIDRPDVMARYRVRLEADRSHFPVLLSNGNAGASGDLPNGRHFAEWVDPWPKPSYLFALVAGELGFIEDRFRTMEGRDVRLRIYAEARAIDRCGFAMDALKRAMRWDEQRFGRAYDLDQFNIVATYDFNMGAMENKGLNIFNAKAIVADLDRATDADLAYVEAVVAHEYFHNWTGNRVTCRDWFQLSLKEGLTVYRDQEFSADQGSRAVKRIDDVRLLRANQFPEDSGPFAHPVRPAEYVEINNFYTATVYEKGAEIVRLYEQLLGVDGFRRGMDLYFQRHDGQAVTTDDFRQAMADANQCNLDGLARWYDQAGTPRLQIDQHYDANTRRLTLAYSQATPPSPGQAEKQPVPIPLPLMCYDRDGRILGSRRSGESIARERHVILIDTAAGELTFEGIDSPPVVSLLQGFSAPIELAFTQPIADLCVRLAHEQDDFNRFEAAQALATHLIMAAYQGTDPAQEASAAQIAGAWANLLDRIDHLDPALVAECLNLPDEAYLSEQLTVLDPARLFAARQRVLAWLGQGLNEALQSLFHRFASAAGGGFSAEATAARRIRHRALELLMASNAGHYAELAYTLHTGARNMTEALAGLSALVHHGDKRAPESLAAFHQRYQDDPLLLDKWLAVQATDPRPGFIERLRGLMAHPAYSHRNPNKVRALLGSFSRLNRTCFHAADGSGYQLLAEAVQTVDALNPQVAARLLSAFNAWRRFEPGRRDLMQVTLARLQAAGLSKDSAEIVGKALA